MLRSSVLFPFALLGLALAVLPGVTAFSLADDNDGGLEAARLAFLQATAKAYSVDPATVSVQPSHAGLPGNPFDPLRTGPFLAFRADFPGYDPGPRGFASASGEAVLAASPSGIKAVLEAAGLANDTPPVASLVDRLSWIYQPLPGTIRIDRHPVHAEIGPPTLRMSTDGSVHLLWHVTRPAETGLIHTWRSEFSLAPGAKPIFKETRL